MAPFQACKGICFFQETRKGVRVFFIKMRQKLKDIKKGAPLCPHHFVNLKSNTMKNIAKIKVSSYNCKLFR